MAISKIIGEMKAISRICIPDEVRSIINMLNDSNYKAYVVGGAVRDSILGREVHDWDICTSATPYEMMTVFKDLRVIETGLQHGTITVLINDMPIEVTTFRIDGKYSDNRRPDNVTFTDDLTEDLRRRDFTMNAIAYNPTTGIVDPFDGIGDIEEKVIVCVGSAKDRFEEDALRILRALRFAGQLNFALDSDITKEIRNLYKLLSNISMERINSEFCKIMQTDMINVIVLQYPELSKLLIPELEDMRDFNQNNPYHEFDVLYHTMMALRRSGTKDLIIRLAILFHDIGKPFSYQDGDDGHRHFKGHGRISAEIAGKIMTRMKFDNDTRDKVVELIYYHDATFQVGKKYVKRWLNKIGEDQLRRLLILRRADIMGQKLNYEKSRIDKVSKMELVLDEVKKDNECFTLKDLAVNGNDLIQLGYKPGKELGNVLHKLLDEVIDGNVNNDKDELLKLSESFH